MPNFFHALPPFAWLLILMGVLYLLPYVLGPFLIHRNLTQKAKPELVPFPPDHPSLPDDVADFFSAMRAELRGIGFELIDGFALPRQTPNVKAVLLLFVNRASRDAALATVMYGEAPNVEARLKTAYLEFATRFRDGGIVNTNNSDQMGAFRKLPFVHTTQFPKVRSAALLFRIHTALAEKYGTGAKVLRHDEEFHGDGRAFLAAAMREELERQIPTGFMWLSEEEGLFRPTWKGAFLMTWGLLFPFKQIRLARRDRKAKRLLAELEVQGKLEG
jgi:hypothetical protein